MSDNANNVIHGLSGDSLIKVLDAQVAELENLAEKSASIQQAIDETRVALWSAGREVRVTVASSGLLQNVEYSARATTLSAEALAALTLRTLRSAIAQLQVEVEELTLGENADSVSTIMAAEYRSAYAAPLAALNGSNPIGYR